MTQGSEYKRTLFDRRGPDATHVLVAAGYGILVFGLTAGAVLFELGPSLLGVVLAVVAGMGMASVPYFFAQGVGRTVKHVWVDGASTPYREQYSYQQALVMQGRVDDALASFEAVIAERPDDADVRIRAAELCAREKHDYARAADFFRDAQRVPSITVGEDVLVTNRLVDLYTGPLQNPGRALVELRRLIEKYPASPAATNARVALATLKARTESASGRDDP